MFVGLLYIFEVFNLKLKLPEVALAVVIISVSKVVDPVLANPFTVDIEPLTELVMMGPNSLYTDSV